MAAGADIEAGNSEGETPLHIMVRRKRLQCVVCLLSHGADVNALGMENETPLHMAVRVCADLTIFAPYFKLFFLQISWESRMRRKTVPISRLTIFLFGWLGRRHKYCEGIDCVWC